MKIKDILKVTNGKLTNLTKLSKEINHFRLDSRKIVKGDCFICVNSGINYIEDAIKNGATLIISEQDIRIKCKVGIVKVNSIKDTLILLGTYIRTKYRNIPFIAITGSVGKSTTKELIGSILSKKYNVLKSDGNKNNYIGVTDTLFKLNTNYDICVLELGMNHMGEIEELSNMVKPDIAIITNIGTSHIGNLGSKRNILKAKLEITSGMSDDGILIVPHTDRYLRNIYVNNVVKCYDIDVGNVRLDNSLTFNLKYKDNKYFINFNVPNRTYITNIILAFKASSLLNIDIDTIVDAINEYKPLPNRMDIIDKDYIKIISDCYNSSYESLIGLLDYAKNQNSKKLIILGDILELGKYSKKIHKRINKDLKHVKDKEVLLVGDSTKYIKGNHFNSNQEIINYLEHRNLDDYLIIIKGSHLMHMEEIKDYLEHNF